MNPVVQASGICDHILMYSIRLSRSARLCVAAVVALTIAGCEAPSTPQFVTHRLVQPLEGPCPTDPAALTQGEFIGEVSEFAATISGPDIGTPLQATGTGSITIDKVPAGEDRIVAMYGLSNGLARWRGVSAPTTFVEGEPITVNVVLAAVAEFSCARSKVSQHVFHTATPMLDGRVLIVGGASTMADASASCINCLKAAATDDAALYDPATGVFEVVGRLATTRMFHTATRLNDGRVVIVGGAGSATFFKGTNTHPFPIVPEDPRGSVEVFDPATKTFTAAGNDPGGPRIFAAATLTLDGEVVVTGGIPSKAQGRPNDLGNALSTSTLCSGTVVACRTGPPLASARAGHVAFTTEPQGVYLFGGSVDEGENRYQVEYLSTAGSQFVHLVRATGVVTRNLFFSGVAQYFASNVLIAGGLRRTVSGGVVAFESGPGISDQAHVFAVDASDPRDPTLKGGSTPGVTMQSTRIFASAAGLPDEESAIVVGGFAIDDLATINWTPRSDLDLFNERQFADADPRMQTIGVNGVARTLRQPRAGATATAVGDGTVVVVGGYVGSDRVAETGEVFADQKAPPQAAEFVR